MPSLADLFNPSFFMILGIIILVVALLVVYYESKMREQNHKIAAMLSLVSTLAEDMNGVKMGLNHLAIVKGGSNYLEEPIKEPINRENNKLIEVSDDEESDSDDENDLDLDSDNELDSELDSDSESENDLDFNHDNNIKVLKININNENDDDNSSLNLEVTEELEDELSDSESSDNEDILSVNLEETTNNEGLSEVLDISSSDLKKININLEEGEGESSVDYKKLPLPKLRNIVSEKGLASDVSKLKKNELLKLLEV